MRNYRFWDCLSLIIHKQWCFVWNNSSVIVFLKLMLSVCLFLVTFIGIKFQAMLTTIFVEIWQFISRILFHPDTVQSVSYVLNLHTVLDRKRPHDNDTSYFGLLLCEIGLCLGLTNKITSIYAGPFLWSVTA